MMEPSAFSTSQWLIPFGAVEILFPAALVLSSWSAIARRSPLLFKVWMLPLCIAGVIVGASKIAFLGWGLAVARIDFTVISGHAMFSAAVYPVAAWLLTASSGRARALEESAHGQKLAVAVGYAFAAAVAVARIRVAAHSWSEIVVGSALGVAVSWYALMRLRREPQTRPPLKLALLVVVGWFVVIPLNAAPSRVQDLVERAAARLAGRAEPFDRWQMHRAEGQRVK